MTILKIVIFLVIFITGVISLTLLVNQANLFEAPGFTQRLKIFFTSNIAATAENHKLKELNTPVYQESAERLFRRVILAVSELGWDVVSHDSDNHYVNIIVRTRMFLFEDDMFVQVKAIDANNSYLYIESKSRQGRADLAANSGHIQELIKKLD